MTAQNKANEIAERFITKSVFDMDNDELKQQRISAKKDALVCVDEIVNSLKITTDHLTLKKSDLEEVQLDFVFWEDVKKAITKL